MLWLIAVLLVLLCADGLLSTVTGAEPIYRSKAVRAGIVTGVVLGLMLLALTGRR